MNSIAYAATVESGKLATMASDKSDAPPGKEILFLNSVYKDPESIFSFRPRPLGDIKSTAIIVLDTNVLLVPFNTGKESLVEIEKVYRRLISEKRLFIPGQVAREFARNRSEKLKDIYQQINRRRMSGLEDATYPLLENSSEYKGVKKLEAEIQAKIREHNRAVNSLLEEIKGWHWNDPVSALYQDLFGVGVVLESSNLSEREIAVELERRYAHNLPPGFKDKGKADRGVGDYLIWSTILEAGKSRGVDAIFVSADRKSDWWIQSENVPLYPRFELIEEYRYVTGGRNIHIVDLATLLGVFGAPKAVVAEVKSKETAPAVDEPSARRSRIRRRMPTGKIEVVARAMHEWVLSQPEVKSIESFERRGDRMSFFAKRKDNTYLSIVAKYYRIGAAWGDVGDLVDAVDEGSLFSSEARVVLVFDNPISAEFTDAPIEALRRAVVGVRVSIGVIGNDGTLMVAPF